MNLSVLQMNECHQTGKQGSLKGGGGEGVKVRFRLSQHLSILLFIAREPQKLDRQIYIYNWNRLFISFSKIQLSDTLWLLV